jgi:hypothetical protein
VTDYIHVIAMSAVGVFAMVWGIVRGDAATMGVGLAVLGSEVVPKR